MVQHIHQSLLRQYYNAGLKSQDMNKLIAEFELCWQNNVVTLTSAQFYHTVVSLTVGTGKLAFSHKKYEREKYS